MDSKKPERSPLGDLAGKVAFITGGSSGIGLGIARACAVAGMKVIITYRTPAHLRAARNLIKDPNAGFHAIQVDVTDRNAMARAADEVESTFGNVHLLCNNAGVGVMTRIIEATFDDWDFAIKVNLGGVINGLQAFLPRMIAHAEPCHVLATASMSGLFHGGTVGLYTTTKFAVVGLMEALRAELAPLGIGVSVACPGLVASKIYDVHRNACGASPGAEQGADYPERMKRFQSLMKAGMDPLECGVKILRGVRRNDLFILTHPEFRQGLLDRCEVLLGSIREVDQAVPDSRARAEHTVLRHSVYIDEKARLDRTRSPT